MKLEASLILCQEVSQPYASIDDIITYTIEVKNLGEVTLFNIFIVDLLPASLQLIDGSIEVDDISESNFNILSGITIDKIYSGQTIVIKFKTQIKSKGYINNQLYATYDYKLDDNNIMYGKSKSNVTTVYVVDIDILLNKSCDKKNALLEDIIDYTITINNMSELDLINLLLIEKIPKYVELIDGSFKLNDMQLYSIDLNQGVSIPCILKNEIVTIKYSLKVKSTICNFKISEPTILNFFYKYFDSSLYKKSMVYPTNCCVEVAPSTFKELKLHDYMQFSEDSSYIECINNISGSIEISKFHVYKTCDNTSTEGQISNGYKVFIHGNLNLEIEYTSSNMTKSVHSLNHFIPFSTVLALPLGYTPECSLDVEGSTKYIYSNNIDLYTIYLSASALITAKIYFT